MDIGSIRKEAEIDSLKSDLSRLRSELGETRRNLFAAEDAEKALRGQLASERQRTTTLERMVTPLNGARLVHSTPLAPYICTCYSFFYPSPRRERSHCGVDLVRRYGELYSLVRLETLDALDRLPELVNSEELKNKLLFSVVVVSPSVKAVNLQMHCS